MSTSMPLVICLAELNGPDKDRPVGASDTVAPPWMTSLWPLNVPFDWENHPQNGLLMPPGLS